MSFIATPDRGAEILIRTIQPNEGGMPAEAARAMLEFKLSQGDRDRVNQLAAKAREGTHGRGTVGVGGLRTHYGPA